MMVCLIVCGAVLGGTAVAGAVWRRLSGVLRPVRRASSTGRSPGGRPSVLTAAQLGQPLGSRATLVQFSSAVCAPCRATSRILTEVAGSADGVAHIDLDAESHLDLVRELGILTTPTVFILAPDGTILRRGSGQPRKADVIAAVAAAAPADAGPGPVQPAGGAAPGPRGDSLP